MRSVAERDVGEARDVSARDVPESTVNLPDAVDAEDAPGALDAASDGSGDADAGEDAGTDVRPRDVRPEVARPPNCGDRIRDPGEECDDGNSNENDGCTSVCTVPRCGDGVVSSYAQSTTETNPVVTNPFGVSGNVCDEGSFCASGETCVVRDDPQASEHGMCQSLGFERAVSARYGRLNGASLSVRALDWVCWNFVCGQNEATLAPTDCEDWEALLELECESVRSEACDDGRNNGRLPDQCRPDCSRPACGDGILDSGEECDDGNAVDDDGCSNRCGVARCGDGVRQVSRGEECDDGNDNDADGCNNACELADLEDIDVNLRTATGARLWATSTTGQADDVSASCGGAGAEDVVFGWVVPRDGRYLISTCDQADWDTVISVREGALDGPEIACDDNACGLQSEVSMDLIGGQILYLLVDGNGGATGDFALSIIGP